MRGFCELQPSKAIRQGLSADCGIREVARENAKRNGAGFPKKQIPL